MTARDRYRQIEISVTGALRDVHPDRYRSGPPTSRGLMPRVGDLIESGGLRALVVGLERTTWPGPQDHDLLVRLPALDTQVPAGQLDLRNPKHWTSDTSRWLPEACVLLRRGALIPALALPPAEAQERTEAQERDGRA